MTSFTVRTSASFDGAAREAVVAAVFSAGGTARWRDLPQYGRCYGLIETPDAETGAGALRAALPEDATLYEGVIVALAIIPAQPEALPALVDAIGGIGGPAGVLACDPCGDALVLEWNPAVTAPSVVLGLVDVELQRWGGGRRAELLAPLPDDAIAAIAAQGLQAPEIAPDRVLETLLVRANLR